LWQATEKGREFAKNPPASWQECSTVKDEGDKMTEIKTETEKLEKELPNNHLNDHVLNS
jgi:hypothetical protein